MSFFKYLFLRILFKGISKNLYEQNEIKKIILRYVKKTADLSKFILKSKTFNKNKIIKIIGKWIK